MDKLLASMMLKSGVAQYPDTNLYNAATLLKPEDRPTVPVELYDDPDPIYEQWGFKGNLDATALVGPTKDRIYVDRNKEAYKKPKRLAAVLAHEQEHVRGGDELQAQEKEYEILRKLIGNFRNDKRLSYLERLLLKRRE